MRNSDSPTSLSLNYFEGETTPVAAELAGEDKVLEGPCGAGSGGSLAASSAVGTVVSGLPAQPSVKKLANNENSNKRFRMFRFLGSGGADVAKSTLLLIHVVQVR